MEACILEWTCRTNVVYDSWRLVSAMAHDPPVCPMHLPDEGGLAGLTRDERRGRRRGPMGAWRQSMPKPSVSVDARGLLLSCSFVRSVGCSHYDAA